MRTFTWIPIAAATAFVALSMPSAARTQHGERSHPEGDEMNKEHEGQMMEGCTQMMHGSSARPNEQWQGNAPELRDKRGRKP